MDIMEKEVFVGAKKREKRTTLLCEKETRLHQSKVQVKTISLSFSHFLSLFLSLSFTPLFVVLLFVSSERARCAVEADKTSTSASIHALLASSHRRRNNMEEEEEETLTETRTTRTTIESLERDVEVRDDSQLSLSLSNWKTLFLSFSRSRSLLNADAPLPSLSLSIYIYIRR